MVLECGVRSVHWRRRMAQQPRHGQRGGLRRALGLHLAQAPPLPKLGGSHGGHLRDLQRRGGGEWDGDRPGHLDDLPRREIQPGQRQVGQRHRARPHLELYPDRPHTRRRIGRRALRQLRHVVGRWRGMARRLQDRRVHVWVPPLRRVCLQRPLVLRTLQHRLRLEVRRSLRFPLQRRGGHLLRVQRLRLVRAQERCHLERDGG